jgi:hypothetical protein
MHQKPQLKLTLLLCCFVPLNTIYRFVVPCILGFVEQLPRLSFTDQVSVCGGGASHITMLSCCTGAAAGALGLRIPPVLK